MPGIGGKPRTSVGTETDRGIPTPSSLQVPAPKTSRGSSLSILRTQRTCRDSCKPSYRRLRKKLKRCLVRWASPSNNEKLSLWLISWPPSCTRSHPSSYTVKVIDESEAIDTNKKAILEQIRDRLIDKVVDVYCKFVIDWERFYATITAQLCPATKEALQRSDGCKTLAASLDPGALLRLIQSTCLNGND